jgi:hypothetical protein
LAGAHCFDLLEDQSQPARLAAAQGKQEERQEKLEDDKCPLFDGLCPFSVRPKGLVEGR